MMFIVWQITSSYLLAMWLTCKTTRGWHLEKHKAISIFKCAPQEVGEGAPAMSQVLFLGLGVGVLGVLT